MENELKPCTDFVDMTGYETYTSEFNLIFQYEGTHYEVPQETYSTIDDAIKSAKEYMQNDKDIIFTELWLQVTGWSDNTPETVGESLLGQLPRADLKE